jgi:hypothetical protein
LTSWHLPSDRATITQPTRPHTPRPTHNATGCRSCQLWVSACVWAPWRRELGWCCWLPVGCLVRVPSAYVDLCDLTHGWVVWRRSGCWMAKGRAPSCVRRDTWVSAITVTASGPALRRFPACQRRP